MQGELDQTCHFNLASSCLLHLLGRETPAQISLAFQGNFRGQA